MTTDTIDITFPNYGTIRGSVDTKRQVAVFRNIPYAHVLERWRVAIKAQPWSGVRDATVQGSVNFSLSRLVLKNSFLSEKHTCLIFSFSFSPGLLVQSSLRKRHRTPRQR